MLFVDELHLKMGNRSSKQLKRTYTLRATKPYIVPANTVMFIKAEAPDLEMNEGSYSRFLEPKVNMLSNNGLLVDSPLCLTNNKSTPLSLTSLTDSVQEKVLGTLYPVDNKCDSDFRGVKKSPAFLSELMHCERMVY